MWQRINKETKVKNTDWIRAIYTNTLTDSEFKFSRLGHDYTITLNRGANGNRWVVDDTLGDGVVEVVMPGDERPNFVDHSYVYFPGAPLIGGQSFNLVNLDKMEDVTIDPLPASAGPDSSGIAFSASQDIFAIVTVTPSDDEILWVYQHRDRSSTFYRSWQFSLPEGSTSIAKIRFSGDSILLVSTQNRIAAYNVREHKSIWNRELNFKDPVTEIESNSEQGVAAMYNAHEVQVLSSTSGVPLSRVFHVNGIRTVQILPDGAVVLESPRVIFMRNPPLNGAAALADPNFINPDDDSLPSSQ